MDVLHAGPDEMSQDSPHIVRMSTGDNDKSSNDGNNSSNSNNNNNHDNKEVFEDKPTVAPAYVFFNALLLLHFCCYCYIV